MSKDTKPVERAVDNTIHIEGCPAEGSNKTASWYKAWGDKCPECKSPADVASEMVEVDVVLPGFVRLKSDLDKRI